jgi:hypothetical protein
MGNFFGLDSQVTETLNIMSYGWIYGFFIIGACLLAASWLVNWQVRRFQQIAERGNAEDKDTPRDGTSDSATGEPPRG